MAVFEVRQVARVVELEKKEKQCSLLLASQLLVTAASHGQRHSRVA